MSGDRLRRGRRLGWLLAALLIAVSLLSLEAGASDVSAIGTLGRWLAGAPLTAAERMVLVDIRLPRLGMGLLVGAALATSGAVMQGLFRNPLADPGLVGVSAGAGLGAILAIVLGGALPAGLAGLVGTELIPVAAFLGGWGAVLILYAIASRRGRTSVAAMLLGGIALSALVGAGSGLLIYVADDRQLRDLTFWGMGSLAGASWPRLLAAAPLMVAGIATAPMLARGLNGLAMGEAAAHHMGIAVQRTKRLAILSVAAAVGAAVAVSGGIGFVGLVIPHLLRLVTGPDHRHLLVNAGLLGGSALVLADLVSRTIVAPAELPIGIITAVVGGPVFMAILLRQRGLLDL